MNRSEQTSGTQGLDDTIGRMEEFYRRIAGTEVPSGDSPYAPIPAEKDPIEHVEEQLTRLFTMLSPSPVPAAAWIPPISVSESETEIVVSVDLPGVPRDAVNVTAQGNALVVSGTRPARSENGQRLWLNERVAGSFRRVIVLMPEVRTSEPAAQMRDGVLEIRIPRDRPAARPRAVAVH